MKKFLVLGLVLLSFSTVWASLIWKSGPRAMSYSAASDFCSQNGMRLPDTNELDQVGGYTWYWVRSGCQINPGLRKSRCGSADGYTQTCAFRCVRTDGSSY